MIEKLKEKIILSDEISKHIEVKKKGNSFWACCPFHHEKTASFVINDSKSFFYCFGCGVKGDIFTFYKEFCKKDFKETLEILGKFHGITVTFSKKNIDELKEVEKILISINDLYKQNLKNNIEVQNYLENRHINKDMIDLFQLGYADESKSIDYLLEQQFSIQNIKKSGINSYGSLDRFRNRIIFPIISKSKQIIGFSGRVMNDEQPKYLNSSETILFQKNLHLYNENNLEHGFPIILVEGYIDVISLTQYGIKNVVASMGTSLTAGQVVSIFKNTDVLYLMFDGDDSGQASVERNVDVILKIITVDKEVFICTLPKNKDPDDVINKLKISNHKDKIENYINDKMNLLEWKWNEFLKFFDYSPTNFSILFDKIDRFLGSIASKNIRRSYRIFFDKNIYSLRSKIHEKPKVNQTINSEDIFFSIVLEKPYFLEFILEEMMEVDFSEKTYNKIKDDIIEKLIVDQFSCEEIITFINQKYEKYLANLLNKRYFSYIINNKSFTLNYLRDILYLINKNKQAL